MLITGGAINRHGSKDIFITFYTERFFTGSKRSNRNIRRWSGNEYRVVRSKIVFPGILDIVGASKRNMFMIRALVRVMRNDIDTTAKPTSMIFTIMKQLYRDITLF